MSAAVDASPEELSVMDKAAILLLTMGADEAAKVLNCLEPPEGQRLIAAMSALGRVSAHEVDRVVHDFLETVSAEQELAVGASEYLKRMLLGALTREQAGSVLDGIVRRNMGGWGRLGWRDPRAIAGLVLREHPQMQAIALSYLEPGQAAEVLECFPDHAVRTEVMVRLSKLASVPPGAVQEVSVVLGPGGRTALHRPAELGGRRAAAEIMSRLSEAAREAVMTGIRTHDDSLGEEIEALMPA